MCKHIHRMSKGNKRVNIYKSPYRAWEEVYITLQHWLNLIVITAVAFDHFFSFFPYRLSSFLSFALMRSACSSRKKCANNFHSTVNRINLTLPFFYNNICACFARSTHITKMHAWNAQWSFNALSNKQFQSYKGICNYFLSTQNTIHWRQMQFQWRWLKIPLNQYDWDINWIN